MQASFFNSNQSSYSISSPTPSFQNIPFPPRRDSGPQNSMLFNQQMMSSNFSSNGILSPKNFMQFDQRAMARNFNSNGMSSNNGSYFFQQSSRSPGGFSNAITAGYYSSSFGPGMSNQQSWNMSSFNQQSFGGGDNRPSGNGGYGGDTSCNNSFDNRNAWSDSGVNDNKASIYLGNYILKFNKSDSSMVLIDTRTGTQTRIWGDPHIDLNSGSANQTSGMFHGPLTFNLPNHTRVSVGTQPSGDSNVSYANDVTVTQGNRAYAVHGLSQKDSAPLTVQRSLDGFALARQTPRDSMNLISSPSGTGWIDAATHAPVKASDFA